MRHADKFGLVCSTSGDCYFEYSYQPGFADAARAIKGEPLKIIEKFWDENQRKGKDDFAALNTIVSFQDVKDVLNAAPVNATLLSFFQTTGGGWDGRSR